MTRKQKEETIEILTKYVQENQTKFYRLAYHYVREEELALDVIQDAIVKALSKITSLRNPEYVKTWFYRILVNECLTNIRRAKGKETVNLEDYDIAEESDRIEFLDVYMHVNRLPKKLKTVILLRFFEGMKLEEITIVTNTNLSTVKSRLYKALQELKLTMMEEEKNEKVG